MRAIFFELRELLGHVNTYVIGVGVGLVAKLSYDIYMKRTLTFVQWCAVISISVFCGYITSAYCTSVGRVELGQVLVPLATLFGEKVVVYLMENHKYIFGVLLSFFKRK